MIFKIRLNWLLTLLCFLAITLPAQSGNLRVMVFAPHPDDELVGCGGSIAKHVSLGNKVTIVYLTSGDAGNIHFKKNELANIRENEARKGMQLMGVNNLIFLKNLDGYLEASGENLVKVVELIREYKPNVIYLPSPDEAHQDHKVTNDLVSKAINKARGSWFQEAKGEPWTVKTIFAYEVYPLLKNVNYCEDTSQFMELKLKALQEHKSQLESMAYDDIAKSKDRYRGILNYGSQYAECFDVLKISEYFQK